MSILYMRMMREARVKNSPAGFNHYSNWHFTKDTKRYKNLYEHINRVMQSLLYLPVVSLHHRYKKMIPSKHLYYSNLLLPNIMVLCL